MLGFPLRHQDTDSLSKNSSQIECTIKCLCANKTRKMVIERQIEFNDAFRQIRVVCKIYKGLNVCMLALDSLPYLHQTAKRTRKLYAQFSAMFRRKSFGKHPIINHCAP